MFLSPTLFSFCSARSTHKSQHSETTQRFSLRFNNARTVEDKFHVVGEREGFITVYPKGSDDIEGWWLASCRNARRMVWGTVQELTHSLPLFSSPSPLPPFSLKLLSSFSSQASWNVHGNGNDSVCEHDRENWGVYRCYDSCKKAGKCGDPNKVSALFLSFLSFSLSLSLSLSLIFRISLAYSFLTLTHTYKPTHLHTPTPTPTHTYRKGARALRALTTSSSSPRCWNT